VSAGSLRAIPRLGALTESMRRKASGPIRTRRLHHTFPPSYYLLEYILVDGYLARRASLRDAHLALAREANERGDLVIAGALAEPPDRAILMWRTDDPSVVESSPTTILMFARGSLPHGPSDPGLSSSATSPPKLKAAMAESAIRTPRRGEHHLAMRP